MIKKCIQLTSASVSLAGALLLGGCTPIPSLTEYRNPYDSPQIFMEGIYSADTTLSIPSASYQIRAAIVPHHLTASTSIASGIAMLKNQAFTNILLLSPDHFSKCPTLLCTTNSLYHTPFGDVRASRSTLSNLVQSPLVTVQPALFGNEHGIHAVLPYIAHYFPDVPVTPVVLSQNPWHASSGALLKTIEAALEPDTLLVVSSDFSHYLTLPKANEQDELTAQALFSKDIEGIARLDNSDQSDCPNCLWVLASIAAKQDFYNPSTIQHTNSAIILNNKSVQETTSHFSMVWYQNALLDRSDLAVAGDVSMTRVKRTPKIPPRMLEFWSGTGTRVVNLEGPLLATCPSNRTMFNFCNSLSLWRGMKNYATHWGIMNNHTLDQYVAGLAETRRLIPGEGEELIDDHMIDAGPYRFIGLTALMNPVLDRELLNIPYQYRQVISELKNKNPGKLTVVFVHEGREYKARKSENEIAYLRTFIDAGADSVVSVHSHVVSDMEIYKGKPIFRGLGNFIFDQYDQRITTTGKGVRLKKSGDIIQFQSFIERI